MNEMLNDLLHGPLGWKVAGAVVAMVGILVFFAMMDGPWSRGKKMPKHPLPRQDLDDLDGDSSSRPEREERKSRKSAPKLSE